MNNTQFPTTDDAINFVCSHLKSALERDIQGKGHASLILTGGETVRPFLKALSQQHIDWKKVWVLLSDERWVPLDDVQSNDKQLREMILDSLPHTPRYLRLKTDHSSPNDAIPDLEKKLEFVPQPISCSLLSMGSDGHVASLFKEEKSAWSRATTSFFHSTLKGDRISLTPKILISCAHTIVLAKRDRDLNLICLDKETLNDKFTTVSF